MAKEKNIYEGPLYSDGTAEQDSKKNQGAVEGPKGGPRVPDPLGYRGKGKGK